MAYNHSIYKNMENAIGNYTNQQLFITYHLINQYPLSKIDDAAKKVRNYKIAANGNAKMADPAILFDRPRN